MPEPTEAEVDYAVAAYTKFYEDVFDVDGWNAERKTHLRARLRAMLAAGQTYFVSTLGKLDFLTTRPRTGGTPVCYLTPRSTPARTAQVYSP